MAWDDNLDPASAAYQIAASESDRIRVVAGPGAGKSFAMKRRVARLLEGGVAPERILPVTFTRVAAEDLHRELVGMGVPGCDEIQGQTLHSLGMRILMRRHVLAATGRTPRPLNAFEHAPLESDLSRFGGLRELRKKIKAYEAAWARLQRDEPGFVQDDVDRQFERELVAWLRFHGATLIGEIIPILHNYLRDNPAAPERHEFAHILIDEYQDLNRAEQAVLEYLGDGAAICIVGDDDQSIYSFKYAHPDGIREWIELGQDAADLTLADCRRCPTSVVDMANSLIENNVDRPMPHVLNALEENGPGDVRILQFQTLDLEVEGIANLIENLVRDGTNPGEILVLAQRGAIGTPIYEALVNRGIPTKSYYAESELDHEDTQRRFSLLKLLVNRDDRVALRWLLGRGSNNWLRGSYARLRSFCEQTGQTPWNALDQVANRTLSIPHTGALVGAFVSIRQQLDAWNAAQSLPELIDLVFPDSVQHVRDIRALSLETIETIENNDREQFLSELQSRIAKPEVPSQIEQVRVMSLHKSKGLSASVTIIAGCVEGLLPKQPDSKLPLQAQHREMEEQRRLFYVGITRVKAQPRNGRPGMLVLTYSRQMLLASAMGAGIKPAHTVRGVAHLVASRFIGELGPAAPQPIAG